MNVFKKCLYLLTLILVTFSSIKCKSDKKKEMNSTQITKNNPITISEEVFGTTRDSVSVKSFTLKNEKGMEVSIITYGGIITTLKVPNKKGVSEDVVLGYKSLASYEKATPYFGALIGRYGNRIANGKFSIDGKEYALKTNDGSNHLHGGLKGFDKVVWTAEVLKDKGALKLSYLSKDMEEGYPGNLNTEVTYTLTNDNTLEVAYQATTDKKTIVNLTQHSYFNLSGDFSKPILDHIVKINADRFVPVNRTLIPTGELKEVANTPFDFREPKTIGQDINADNEQLKRGLGYDHCWVLNDQNEGIRFTSSAYEPNSGRLLEVFSDEPGIQLYTGNFLDGTLPNKQGGTYAHRTGFCLETQHYPDSPNQKDFPSTILRPGDTYSTTTSFKFSVK